MAKLLDTNVLPFEESSLNIIEMPLRARATIRESNILEIKKITTMCNLYILTSMAASDYANLQMDLLTIATIIVKELYASKYLRNLELNSEDMINRKGKKSEEIINRNPELDRPRALSILLATERLKQWATERIINDM